MMFQMCRIEDCLLRRGWDRIHDNLSTGFYLKWVELKSQIQYPSFKEGVQQGACVCACTHHSHTSPSPSPPTDVGRQLVNHFPNIGLLTTKTGLLESLRELSQSKPKQPSATARCAEGATHCARCLPQCGLLPSPQACPCCLLLLSQDLSARYPEGAKRVLQQVQRWAGQHAYGCWSGLCGGGGSGPPPPQS